MTALDIMVLLSLGVAGVLGTMRGFISEIFSLGAWLAGIVAVKYLQPGAAVWLTGPVGTSGGAAVLSVALVFGVVFIAVRLIGNRLGASTRGSLLGPVDRVLGLGFGLLKGLIAATLAFLLMSLVFDLLNGATTERPPWMTESKFYHLLRASSTALVSAVEAGRAR